MSPRARSVISPPLPPRARKIKATPPEREAWAPRPGAPTWRVRDTTQTDPQRANVYLHDRDAAEELAAVFGGIVETLYRGYWGTPHREVPTVADLARGGEDTEPLAREVTLTRVDESGKTKTETRWVVHPIGQQIILDAMLGLDD